MWHPSVSFTVSFLLLVGLAVNKAAATTHLHLSPIEKNLLEWNTKHTEYSFGANLDSLSMRYWDAGKHCVEGQNR